MDLEPYYQNSLTTLYKGDCLEIMPRLEGKFDAIICDLPYGITACKWDSVIPLDRLWENYKRLIKPKGAIVLFGSQPFTSRLISSNYEWFKYEIIWEKTIAVGFQNANHQPLKSHENIIVFSPAASTFSKQGSMAYNPQKQEGKPYTDNRSDPRSARLGHRAANTTNKRPIQNTGDRVPRSVFKFSNGNNATDHPTQKPIALLDYLIRTYTNEGDILLDNTSGSGTTLIASQLTGRRSVGIEQEQEYCDVTARRLQEITAQQDVSTNQSNIESVQPMLFTLGV